MNTQNNHTPAVALNLLLVALVVTACTTEFKSKPTADTNTTDTGSSTKTTGSNTDGGTNDDTTLNTPTDSVSDTNSNTATSSEIPADTSVDTATETDSVTGTDDTDTGTDSSTSTYTVPKNCLLISEYLEYGPGNRALELFNCSEASIRTKDFSICLVRDTDTDCTVSYEFLNLNVPVRSVATLCNPSLDTSYYKDCDFESQDITSFNGNDRILLKGEDGTVIDAFGDPSTPPANGEWAMVEYRRTNLIPCSGGAPCAVEEYFEPVSDTDLPFGDFGVAP